MVNKFSKKNKITILLPYYNRPNMVRFALKSLKTQNYNNWQLLFCDDNSEYSGEKILYEYFSGYKNVFYINTKTPIEDKLNYGSSFGKFLNDFIIKTDSDICIALCDDDALVENYLSNLNDWYNQNPNILYSYCHIIPFNPFKIKSLSEVNYDSNFWLNRTKDVNPIDVLDSSQVSWKTSLFKINGIRYPYPRTMNLDSLLYEQLFEICGPCVFNGLVGQYKAIHDEQLGNRHDYNTKDINYLPL